MVGLWGTCIFWTAQNLGIPCQSLERRLIPCTAISCGQTKFRVGGDYTTGDEHIWNIGCLLIYWDNPQPLNTTDTISIFHRSTRSFNSLPGLKNGNFFGLIFTFSPVFGLRPVYDPYSLTWNEHNPRISTRSPFASAAAISLKKISTTAAAWGLDRLF